MLGGIFYYLNLNLATCFKVGSISPVILRQRSLLQPTTAVSILDVVLALNYCNMINQSSERYQYIHKVLKGSSEYISQVNGGLIMFFRNSRI